MKKKVIEHFYDFCQKNKVDFDVVEAYLYDYCRAHKVDVTNMLEYRKKGFLSGSFTWFSTEEGFEYWQKVDIKWRKYYEGNCR